MLTALSGTTNDAIAVLRNLVKTQEMNPARAMKRSNAETWREQFKIFEEDGESLQRLVGFEVTMMIFHKTNCCLKDTVSISKSLIQELLFDMPNKPGGGYKRLKTDACEPRAVNLDVHAYTVGTISGLFEGDLG
jgi:hypothetical protein